MTRLLFKLLLVVALTSCAAPGPPQDVAVVKAERAGGEIRLEPFQDPESGEASWRMNWSPAQQMALNPVLPPRIVNQTEIPGDLFAVYMFRHAEKLAVKDDPDLTAFGHARARFLAGHLSAESLAISRIWSSDYARTRNTALPLSQGTGIPVSLYDPRQLRELVDTLRSQRQNAVVIGHSNTTPALASMLCQCEVGPMAESEYERGYVVVLGTGINYLYETDMRQTWDDRPGEAAGDGGSG